jgi:hypothetical protein
MTRTLQPTPGSNDPRYYPADRCYHYNDEVRHPMREDPDGCGFVVDAEGLDFCGVGP